MNQFRPVTMIARTTPGTHNPRISAQTVTLRLREIGERPPYTMYVLYAAFLFFFAKYIWQNNDVFTPKHAYCLFVCFVALRPKSTAIVIAGRSVHLTTLFPGQA